MQGGAGLQKQKKPISEPEPSLTLGDCFQKFRVSDDLTVLHLWHTVQFLGLAPEVGAPVHAGYVEDGKSLHLQAAQGQRSPATLAEEKENKTRKQQVAGLERQMQKDFFFKK